MNWLGKLTHERLACAGTKLVTTSVYRKSTKRSATQEKYSKVESNSLIRLLLRLKCNLNVAFNVSDVASKMQPKCNLGSTQNVTQVQCTSWRLYNVEVTSKITDYTDPRENSKGNDLYLFYYIMERVLYCYKG